jgi:hypothetical protein
MSTHEWAVLALLLDQHPGLLSIDEVVRHLAWEHTEFADGDAVDVAIRALVEAGLVHQLERFVFASEPAAYFARLGDESET